MIRPTRLVLALALALFPMLSLLRVPLPAHAFTILPLGAPVAEIQVGGATDIMGALAYRAADNNFYVVDNTNLHIYPVNATTGVVGTPIDISSLDTVPINMVVGPDSNLYVTDSVAPKLLQIIPGSPPTIHVLVTAAPTASIVVGHDGNLYATEPGISALAEFHPTIPPTIVSQTPGPYLLRSLTVDRFGTLWVTSEGFTAQDLLHYTTSPTGPQFAGLFPISFPFSIPADITAAPDGNLYTIDGISDYVGRFDPVHLSFTILFLPAISTLSLLHIGAGADGNLYVTNFFTNLLSILTTTGKTVNIGLATPSPAQGLNNVVPGPDGNMWISEIATGKVAVVRESFKLLVAGATLAEPNGTPFTVVVGTITDTKPGVTAAGYTATITWGDGTASGTGVIAGNNPFTISGSHTYAAHGRHLVKIVVTPVDGRPTVTQFAAIIS